MAISTNTLHNLFKKPLALAILAIGGFLFIWPFSAQATTVYPTRLELSGNPGSTISTEFNINNDSDNQQTFYTETENFESKDETGNPSFVNMQEGLQKWVSMPLKITIGPRETAKIPVEIRIPDSADPGGYFGAVFARPAAPVGGQVTIGTRVGTIVLLTVNGSIPKSAQVLEYGINKRKRFFTSLPITFYYRFQNSGKDREKPEGNIDIKALFGWTAKKLDANRTNGSTLPGSIRRYESYWINGGGGLEDTKLIPDDRTPGKFWDEVKYQFQHFAFGIYNAQLNIKYGDNQTYKNGYWFIVFPWQLLSIAVPSLLLLIIIVKIFLNRYRDSVIKKYQRK